MSIISAAYLAPLLPILTRAFLLIRFRLFTEDLLPEEAHERSEQRSLILALAGFSFTGLLALVVIDSTMAQKFNLAIFYLLTSFLGFMWSLNLQGYKARRWEASLAVGLIEMGSLSLLLAVISILWLPTFDRVFSVALSLFALFIWGLDHFLRLKFEYKYLEEKEKASRVART